MKTWAKSKIAFVVTELSSLIAKPCRATSLAGRSKLVNTSTVHGDLSSKHVEMYITVA